MEEIRRGKEENGRKNNTKSEKREENLYLKKE